MQTQTIQQKRENRYDLIGLAFCPYGKQDIYKSEGRCPKIDSEIKFSLLLKK